MTEPTHSAATPDPAASPDFRIWHFATAVFDERSQELRVAGRLAELERKPTELLRHLLRHAGEVVTREELLEAVWPGRIATEASLAKAVSRVRQELGDSEQTLIRTIHGYGYRLVAEVRIERPEAEREARTLPRRFNLHPGMAVPERPLWQLREHLASGGQGEVWLAEQPKSGERRVLKFAVDASGLLALKREITLYRLLREAVGPAARCVRLIDWNLETEPFFTESEHIGAGSFVDWAAGRGGLAAIPLAVRLELLAQAAEALAAAHSVGVLHRDLKPANLLIDDSDPAAPQVRLADLGSGGLVEPTALDRYAITRIGLTQSLLGSSDSGTLAYRAPELLAGQLATARADIHALGVMLYQCAVGDFARPMAVGWEADIDDPVLRADIAQAAAGNPALRLADAAEFAHRLRSLDARRAQWHDDEAGRAAAEQQRLENQRLKARRFWLRATVAVLLIGLGTSLWLYVDSRAARLRAERAADTALAVSDFLNRDLLSSFSAGEGSVHEVDLGKVFTQASNQVATRLAAQPEAAAEVYSSLITAFSDTGITGGLHDTQQRALKLVEDLLLIDPPRAVRVAVLLLRDSDQVLPAISGEHIGPWKTLATLAKTQLPTGDSGQLMLRNVEANLEFDFGDAQRGLALEETVVRDAVRFEPEAGRRANYRWFLAWMLTFGPQGNRLGEAEQSLRDALADLAAHPPPTRRAEAAMRNLLGTVLAQQQRFDDGERELLQAKAIYAGLTGDRSKDLIAVRQAISVLRERQGRHAEAVAILEENEPLFASLKGAMTLDLLQFRAALGYAYAGAGRYEDAARLLGEIIDRATQLFGSGDADVRLLNISRIEPLARAGHIAEARALLAEVRARIGDATDPVSNEHRFLAQTTEVDIALAEQKFDLARPALATARQLCTELQGPEGRCMRRVNDRETRLGKAG
ncbi:winged helix-turn-helix domain-containing protein [Nevskia sp.]|uniref:protein kinase domain-containing protein n=1 Tax=Nevskia sp. TaxID=1929292 RepID=UPI0025FE5DC1|nr:winged helix-turn-helix domain-containing protein [Nevskia sp.]